MHWFFWLLLATLIGGGYYVYQRLRQIEGEIRNEQNPSAADEVEEDSSAKQTDEVGSEVVPAAQDQVGEDVSAAILALVALNHGLPQAELYTRFPDHDRRDLQKRLRDLDQDGRLRREKVGSSYRLYPL